MTEKKEEQRISESAPGAYDVVGVGYTCLDFLATVPGMPEIDTKMEISSLAVQGGGPTATALVTLAKLGLRTALIAAVGDDIPGRVAMAELAREGVDTSAVSVQRGASSQVAFILVDEPTGKRTVLWTRGSLEFLAGPDLDPGLVLSAKCLLIDDLEVEAQAEAAALAAGAGIPVVMDAGTHREGVEKLVPLATHLVASERFPRAFTGIEDMNVAAEKLLGMGPETVVVTLGSKGCLAVDKSGRRIEQPAFEIKAVDTTGAGDVFHGAYIRGLLEDWDLPRVLEFACAVAALKCTKPGGRKGIPSMAGAMAFLGW
jgi:ribokinase